MKYRIGFPDSLLSETQLNKENENVGFVRIYTSNNHFSKVTMVVDEFMKNAINYEATMYIKAMKNVNEKIPADRLYLFHEIIIIVNIDGY